MDTRPYLKETTLLNYHHKSIQSLIKTSGWKALDTYKQIGAVYDYVRDAIYFGYSPKDELKASDVLASGIGQCNTKGILLMALLRALNIPCKIEGFKVDASFQKELLPRLIRPLSPKTFLHTRILVYYDKIFIPLEGYILDREYLMGLRNTLQYHSGPLYGYAVATKDFDNLNIEWEGKETYIQKDAITKTLKIFNDPDSLFVNHKQPLSKPKQFVYKIFIRHLMNHRVRRIRKQEENI